MNLAKDIVSLLYSYDCVILPNVGAFITNPKAAEINEIAKTATTRSKTVAFNAQIQSNDGLLANYVSKRYNLPYSESINLINVYVNDIKKSLEEKRNAEIQQLGTFYKTKEDKLLFVPYHSVNFQKESYGLPKLRLKTLSQPTVKVENEVKAEVKVETQTKHEIKSEPTVAPVVQNRRVEKQQERVNTLETRRLPAKNRRRNSNLNWVNVVGSLFLVAMFFTIINFEMNDSSPVDVDMASIIDTSLLNDSEPSIQDETQQTEVPETEEVNTTTAEVSFTTYAICISKVASEFEAVEIANDLNAKFAQSKPEKNDDGSDGVFIISFTNQALALEYKEYLQNKFEQKLIIKNK